VFHSTSPLRHGPGTLCQEDTPWRHLALRVIAQAVHDLDAPGSSAADHESARAFLEGSWMLRHWCRVADLDPAWAVDRARHLIESRDSIERVRMFRTPNLP